jgi:PTH1 family peptidyl-tRNA hydrolase
MCAALVGGQRGSGGLNPAASPRRPDPRSQVPIELVAGLGNPGQRYAATRHNVGFRVVDEIARRHADAEWVRRAHSEVTTARLGSRLVLAKPLTFMNRSGEAVYRLLDLLDIEPAQVLVVVDDIDLPLGMLRLRPSGGAGTHNGLRDVCSVVGEGFPRLRLGVRGDGMIDDLAAYVLSPFDGAEEMRLPGLVARAADAVETAVVEGLERAMGRFNRRDDQTS